MRTWQASRQGVSLLGSKPDQTRHPLQRTPECIQNGSSKNQARGSSRDQSLPPPPGSGLGEGIWGRQAFPGIAAAALRGRE